MHAKYNYLASTNTTTGISFSGAQLLSDVISLLSGVTDKTLLTGKMLLASSAVGITNGSVTVTWAGASTNNNIVIGQPVFGTGIPAGATVATITDQVGFTLSLAATVTNAAAILMLEDTATLPPSTIGSTTVNIGLTNASAVVAWTGTNAQTVVPGMLVTGYGIPAGAVVISIVANTSFTMSAPATVTQAGAAIQFIPAASAAVAGRVCDTGNTSILTTYNVGGWQLWDQYGNAGKVDVQILRAPLSDDATQFKYIGLSIKAADVDAAGGIAIHCYEYTSQVSHAVVNQATAQAAINQQRTTTTAAASIIINASPRHCLMQSSTALGIGCLGSASALGSWTGVFERTRLAPWDTVVNGYPLSVLANGSIFSGGASSYTFLGVPRIKNPAGGDFITGYADSSTSLLGLCTIGWSSTSSGNSTSPTSGPYQTTTGLNGNGALLSKVPDGAGGFYTPLNDVHVRSGLPTVSWPGGSISQASDIWLGPGYALNLDEVNYAGKTYVILRNSAYSAPGNIAVPKG